MLEMPIKRDKETGRPIKTRRKLSQAAKELQEKAILTLQQELEAGRQGKRSLPECCREFGLSPDLVRTRMTREDWATPDRITKRKTNIVAEAQRNGGAIYRPDGCTKTDSLALDHLRAESVQIRVLLEPEPVREEVRKPETKGRPNIRKTLDFSEGDRKPGKPTNGITKQDTDTSKNFPNIPPKAPPVSRSNKTTSARTPEAEDGFDEKVATLAERSLTKFYESGGLIPIHKVGDLKTVDELYRRATRQKTGGEGRRSIIQIGVLSQVSQDSVRRETSVVTQVIEGE